ncbi:MAG TPA: sugar kinase [Gemmatimonadales bacterium]|nr:sugar kinase [Gemmatimonadales bacterium]
MTGVVTFGELLLRLSPPGEERLLASPHFDTYFGGAEANVAVALSHFGVPCEYVSRLPENPLGDAGLAALQHEGVGTRWTLRGGERLGLYFVEPGADLRTMRVVYDRSHSAFAQLDPDALDWDAILAGATWFHATGITAALGEGPARALAAAMRVARASRQPVSLDLNYRAALWLGRDPRPIVEPLARSADLVIGNAAALEAMLGIAASDGRLAERVAGDLGCRYAAVTERESIAAHTQRWSAVLYDAAQRRGVASSRHEIAVVDRVGGGDCFAGALIARLLVGAPPAEALEFAVCAGALKITQPGDFSRLSVADVEGWRRR